MPRLRPGGAYENMFWADGRTSNGSTTKRPRTWETRVSDGESRMCPGWTRTGTDQGGCFRRNERDSLVLSGGFRLQEGQGKAGPAAQLGPTPERPPLSSTSPRSLPPRHKHLPKQQRSSDSRPAPGRAAAEAVGRWRARRRNSYPYGPRTGLPSASSLGPASWAGSTLGINGPANQTPAEGMAFQPPHCTRTSHEADSLSVRLVRRRQVLPAGRGQGKQDAREFLVSHFGPSSVFLFVWGRVANSEGVSRVRGRREAWLAAVRSRPPTRPAWPVRGSRLTF